MHSQNPTAEEVQTLRDINQSMSKIMDTASTLLKSTLAKYEQEIAGLRASLAAATPAPLQPAAAMLSAIDGLRATVAQAEADLNLTIDGERLAAAVAPPTDKAKVDPIEALIKEWTLAVNPRVNGGWTAKGWRNGHCYSESRDTLAEAVSGVVAQLKAATSELEAAPPTAKTKRTNAIITRQADAVIAAIAAGNTSKEALSESLLGAFNKGVELSVIIAKFLRAQVKIVRAEGGDPSVMQTKIDVLEAAIDRVL